MTGKYDSATYQAVKDFQNYVNQRYNPKEKLTVDGAAGPKTLQWLYETHAQRPTATPAPKGHAEAGGHHRGRGTPPPIRSATCSRS